MEIKGILLDFDGVLVYSEPVHLKAWYDYLRSENHQIPSFLDLSYITGVPDEKIAGELRERLAIDDSAQEICRKKRSFYLENLHHPLDYPEGRNEFLAAASEKWLLGIVSSAPRGIIDLVLSKDNLLQYFRLVIAKEDTEKHKPDPAPYLAALERIQLEPGKVLAVEDSRSGILAALNSKTQVVIMESPSGIAEFPELKRVKNFHELRQLLFR